MRFGGTARRSSIARQGILLSLVVWGALVGYALLRDGTHWPQARPAVPSRNLPATGAGEAWMDLLTVALVAELFAVKAFAMARRTRSLTWLGASLIAADAVIAGLFLWTLAAGLFGWQTTFWVRQLLLRWPLILTAGAAIVAIGTIRDDAGGPIARAWDGTERRTRERRRDWPPPPSPA